MITKYRKLFIVLHVALMLASVLLFAKAITAIVEDIKRQPMPDFSKPQEYNI